MNLFTVDKTKCKKDGICAAVCPRGVIELSGERDYPTPVKDASKLCVNCGHCIAVCPHGALSLERMKPDECSRVQKELLPDPDQVGHFLSARRSTRNYLQKPVEKETLSKLISFAGYAPSGCNFQPVNWLVIEDAAKIELIAGLVIEWMRIMVRENPESAELLSFESHITGWEKGEDKIFRGAPHIIIAHSPVAMTGAQLMCTIALTHLELAAFSLGLGACWAGFLMVAAMVYPPLQQALNLPEGHQCYGAMMVGYPKYEYNLIPKRNTPRITWV